MVERSLMVQWFVVGLIPHGGPIVLIPVKLVPHTGITKALVCTILFMGWWI